MKKLIATALIAAMSLTMRAGCGNGGAAGSKDVTDVALKVWVPQNQLDTGIIEEQQKSFADLHPEWNITWTTEIVGEDVAKENILRDVEAAADVFLFASDQLVELVNAGAIARSRSAGTTSSFRNGSRPTPTGRRRSSSMRWITATAF